MKWFRLLFLIGLISGCGEIDRGKAYITSQDGGVSVIDLNTMELVESIKSGDYPRGIGITADGEYLITANKAGANVSVINLNTKEIEKNIDVGINPEFVRVYEGQVFVSTEPSSTGKPPAKGEIHEDEDEDEEDRTPAKIAVVDIASGKKIREITAGPETEGIEFSKDGSQIIVTNEADNTITVHDFSSGDLLKTINAEAYGLRPRGIKVSPNGKFYVATLEHSDNFIVLDKEFNHVKTVKTKHDVSEDNLHKGKSPYGVSFSPSGDKLFVAASGGYKKRSSLEVYDGKSFEKINRVETNGRRCWHFTFTPDKKDILLACGRSDEVLVIDSDTLNISKRIPVKGIPWGIVTYPKAIGSLDQVIKSHSHSGHTHN
ncbi:beta-propeller fold lactonase family protein [Methylophilaceae bacterium]|jgi:YVTN family beta-propeller protein|nr:beta-propeller fold lactonase family protein [Methylophilaceae bacterium]|tara:strand:+ start:72 stop:1193 length:1122 start_codon:yes stop_codon:yes gene_type:complete